MARVGWTENRWGGGLHLWRSGPNPKPSSSAARRYGLDPKMDRLPRPEPPATQIRTASPASCVTREPGELLADTLAHSRAAAIRRHLRRQFSLPNHLVLWRADTADRYRTWRPCSNPPFLPSMLRPS